jgi:ribonuclease HII
LLVDYLEMPGSSIPYTPLVKGDRRSLSIAAASILAKTARDRLLRELDALYPRYGFASHKGYGTPAHLAALQTFGPSPVHRLSFKPSC